MLHTVFEVYAVQLQPNYLAIEEQGNCIRSSGIFIQSDQGWMEATFSCVLERSVENPQQKRLFLTIMHWHEKPALIGALVFHLLLFSYSLWPT